MNSIHIIMRSHVIISRRRGGVDFTLDSSNSNDYYDFETWNDNLHDHDIILPIKLVLFLNLVEPTPSSLPLHIFDINQISFCIMHFFLQSKYIYLRLYKRNITFSPRITILRWFADPMAINACGIGDAHNKVTCFPIHKPTLLQTTTNKCT